MRGVMSIAGNRQYRGSMKIALLTTFLSFMLPLVEVDGGCSQDDVEAVDEAVEAGAEAEGDRKIGAEDIEAAVHEALGILLARQEGSDSAEWPYQGVYRVRAEADDPDSLIEGRGRRRTVIPIGYRVGGTSIAGRAVMRPPGLQADQARRDALERARRFVVGATSHPRMTPDFGGGYDVRGWGYIYALGFLLEMRERGLVDEANVVATDEAIRFYIDALDQIEIPEVGGWNYARRGPLNRPDATSPFMTPPGIQALREAARQGFVVPEGMVERAMGGLELTRGEDGYVAYAARRKTTDPPSQIPGAIGRMAAVVTVRSEMGRSEPGEIQTACKAFFEYWNELLKRKEKSGTHQPPYGVAPYYFMFAHGYLAEAIEQLPEAEREDQRQRLRALLMSVRDEAGGWNDRVFDRSTAYGTAIAILALTQPAESVRERGNPGPPTSPPEPKKPGTDIETDLEPGPEKGTEEEAGQSDPDS